MGDITRLLTFKKTHNGLEGKSEFAHEKKIQFLIMSKPTERVTDSTLIYIFKPETKQHTPSFLVQL